MAVTPNGIRTYFNIPQNQYDASLAVVLKAQAAWAQVVQQFAAENIALGITKTNKAQLVGLALQEVNMYGSTGALWQVFDALNRVKVTDEMSPYLTLDRVQWMKNIMIQIIGTLPG